MPILFARAQFIQRSEGHSAIAAAAYIARSSVSFGGSRFDYRDRGDLIGEVGVAVPDHCSAEWRDWRYLWKKVELLGGRQDASLGLHLILALPSPQEMRLELARKMVDDFVNDVIVTPHEVGVTYALHHPHRTGHLAKLAWLEPDALTSQLREAEIGRARNMHAHLLITPRQLGPVGLSPRRYMGLDPDHRSSKSKSFVAEGYDWPKLWLRFQNAFFGWHGLKLRVRPQSEFSDRHRGKLAWSGAGDAIEKSNRAVAQDPASLLSLVDSRPFVAEDLHEQVRRYVGVGHPLDDTVADDVLRSDAVVRLADTVTRKGSPWYTSLTMARAEQRCLSYATALVSRSPAAIGLLDIESDQTRSDLLKSALAAGESWVAIAHGWGRHFGFRTSTLRSIERRMPTADVLFVDAADALTSSNLAAILAVTVSSPSLRLIIGRRSHSPLMPRNPLLDVVQHLVEGTRPTPPTNSDSLEAAWKAGYAADAIWHLHGRGSLLFSEPDEIVDMVKQLVTAEVVAGRRCVVKTANYELGAIFRLHRLPARTGDTGTRSVLVHSDTNFDQLPVLMCLGSSQDPILVADRTYAPNIEALIAQAQIAAAPLSGICYALADDDDALSGLSDRPRVHWAVSTAGRLVTSPLDVFQAILAAGTADGDIRPQDYSDEALKRLRSTIAIDQRGGEPVAFDRIILENDPDPEDMLVGTDDQWDDPSYSDVDLDHPDNPEDYVEEDLEDRVNSLDSEW